MPKLSGKPESSAGLERGVEKKMDWRFEWEQRVKVQEAAAVDAPVHLLGKRGAIINRFDGSSEPLYYIRFDGEPVDVSIPDAWLVPTVEGPLITGPLGRRTVDLVLELPDDTPAELYRRTSKPSHLNAEVSARLINFLRAVGDLPKEEER